MKEKMKAKMNGVLEYCGENFEGMISIGYAILIVADVVFIICSTVSVLKKGIYYRR